MIEKIRKILDTVPREEALKILAEIITDDYELSVAGHMIKKDCEPYLSKEDFLEHQYSEGNEEAGFIDLVDILGFVEEIVNCQDENYGDIEFQYFVREETEEELEEEGHDKNVTWFTEDESIDMKKLQIQFEMSY